MGTADFLKISNRDGTAFLSAPKTILRRPARSTLVAGFRLQSGSVTQSEACSQRGGFASI
jgi:hypothetical protein